MVLLSPVISLCLLLVLMLNGPACTSNAFVIVTDRPRAVKIATPSTTSYRTKLVVSVSPNDNNNNNDNNKFDLGQRLESIKCLVVGALAGGIAVAPFCALHHLVLWQTVKPMIVTNTVAQWELMNDMAALQAGLFAIVYRYCVRNDESKQNPQLGQGVVGAFAMTRTLGSLVVPTYCTAVPLNCACLWQFAVFVGDVDCCCSFHLIGL